MMLLANFIPGWVRIGGLIAIVLAIGFAGWKVNGWRQDAGRLQEAEAQRDAYAESIKKAGQAIADYSQAVAKIEGERDSARTALDGVRAERPQTLIQIREVPANGSTCSAVSVGPDFVRLWNDAASAYDSMP